jgi:PleD family two-component response regulator
VEEAQASLLAGLSDLATPAGVAVTASLGMVAVAGGSDLGAAMRAADEALYVAKATRRHRLAA